MATENNLDMQAFNDDDVLSFKDGTVRLIKLRQALDIALSSKLPDALTDSLSCQKLHLNADRYFRESRAWGLRDGSWFREGVQCEMLQLGANCWRKGKLRLRVVVEFVEEEEGELLEAHFDSQDSKMLESSDILDTHFNHELSNGNGKAPLLNKLA